MFRRYLSRFLGSIIVLAFCAAVLANLWGVVRLNEVQSEEAAQLESINQGVHLALDLQIHFKMMLLEWENMLLRGTDPDLFEIHFNRFEVAEQQLGGYLDRLRALPAEARVPLSEVEQLEASLRELGRQYRLALEDLDPSGGTSFLMVDRAVQGKDVEPNERMTALVDSIHADAGARQVAAQKHRAVVARVVIFGCTACAVTGLVCSVLFVADRMRRERALMNARINAENANRAKDLFLTNMSHELRTPLNGVIGMSSVLNQTKLNMEQHECVETIKESGVILLDLVSDILDVARIAEGQFTINDEPFWLFDRLDECCDVVASRAAMKDLDFCLDIDGSLPQMINGDAPRLRQVLINLLGNAVKFTFEGSITLRVRRVTETLGDWLDFAVEDTGIGLRRDDQECLFKAFSQIDSSSTRRHGGSGLGLVISRDLARLMGGRIELKSKYGKGSTFTLRIPYRPSKPTALDGEPVHLPDLTDWRIGLLDTSSQNAPMLKRLLEKGGAKVDHIQSACAFRRAVKDRESWHLLVFGELPDIDDDETFAHELRDQHGGAFEYLLRWTRRGTMERLEGRDEFDGFFYKPLKIRQFSQVVENLTTPEPRQIPVSPVKDLSFVRKVLSADPSILVVDDNLINLKVASRFLLAMGFNDVDQASSGEEAIDRCQIQDYDIIFMDMQMPGLDGLDTTRILRQRGNSKTFPWVVALTANAMEQHRQICLEAGMNDYISKPVNRISFERAFDHFSKARGQKPKSLSEPAG